MAVRVLVTDGSSETRDTLRRHLECIGCQIVAEANTAAQALPLFRTVRPEVVILGIELRYGAQPNPLELVQLILREAPGTSVLMIAQTLSEEDAETFRQAGAVGCFAAPFQFASLWRALSMAHPELMAGAFASMMSAAAANRASRA